MTEKQGNAYAYPWYFRVIAGLSTGTIITINFWLMLDVWNEYRKGIFTVANILPPLYYALLAIAHLPNSIPYHTKTYGDIQSCNCHVLCDCYYVSERYLGFTLGYAFDTSLSLLLWVKLEKRL